jgi:enolase
MQIETLHAREILDSRGNPTVEVDLFLKNGIQARASVPSGASTGSREAYEWRDNDQKRYGGKGVLKAVAHIHGEIQQALQGVSVEDQEHIDTILCTLDGTENKSRLGANTLLAVSLSAARAYAKAVQQPLFITLNQGETPQMPIPMMNILNGGAHADNTVDIQEFMIMPIGAKDFKTALQMGAETFHILKSILKKQGLNTAVGDEGGFAPDLQSNRQALDILSAAVEKAGFQLGEDIVFALDIAASELYKDDHYFLASENKAYSALELIDYYDNLISNYPIISIEDGLHEKDWTGWKQLTTSLGQKIQLVGDDIFVTNSDLLQQGIDSHIANAILIKPNQIGTLTETRKTLALAKKHGYQSIVSHRSGETEDTFIADLAVATGCGQIKTGSLCRTDRLAKYNQLLRIEEYGNYPYVNKTKEFA